MTRILPYKELIMEIIEIDWNTGSKVTSSNNDMRKIFEAKINWG